MRFEKVSYEAFRQDMLKIETNVTESVIKNAYNAIKLPERATENSAGYDFFTPLGFWLPKKCSILVPTGIKCFFNENEAKNWHLKLYPRSSLGIRHNIVLSNGTGVIDSDYYGNPYNEGDIMISLFNYGYKGIKIYEGDKIMQGIFEAYAVTDDDAAYGVRTGGLGSTGR